MSLLIDTDDEMNRYDEAALYSRTVKPDMAPGIRSSFNVGTGQTDLLAPLPSGGFVKLGSQAPEITVEAPDVMMTAPVMPGMGADAALPVEDDEFQLQSIRNFAASGANISSRDDYLAAGYSDQLIDASGVMGETQQETGSIEPLSTTEIEGILSEGGSVFQNSDPTMRENGATALTETLIELRVDERRKELLEQYAKPDASEAETEALNVEISRIIASEQPEMRSLSENLADAVFGNKNVLGTGVGDFVTAGVMDMQEGWRMYTDALRNDSPANRALGVLLMAAGVAEATGVGLLLGKTIKKSIPIMQNALVSAGQNAELRMAERGPAVDFLSSTMMSGVPVDVVTDPLVAAAGRAVGGDLSKQVDDARVAYEASPNDAALRKNYLGLRRQRDADPVAQVELPTDEAPGIIAFHGSGTDFSEFKLEKIGTGEGAQAFGYGLYFADSEDIANFYRQTVGGGFSIDNFSIGGIDLVKRGTYRDYSPGATPFGRGPYTPVNQLSAKDYALSSALEDIFIDEYDLYDLKKATGAGDIQTPKSGDELKQTIVARLQKTVDNKDPVNQKGEVEYLQGLISDIENGKAPIKFETEQHGHTYKVGLSLKPEDMLDYDKPLSEQPENIQTAFKSVFYNNFIKGDADLEALFTSPNDLSMQDMGLFDRSTGSQAYAELADKLGKTIKPVPLSADGTMMPTEAIASQALFEAGIPGIKYRAAGSRGANVADANAGRNYVIFDDSMIKILEKYGIVGPVAISAMALSEDES